MAVAILSPRVPRAQVRRIGRPVRGRRIGFLWGKALDSAAEALDAATVVLPASEIDARRRQLRLERDEARALLRRCAGLRGIAEPPYPLHRA